MPNLKGKIVTGAAQGMGEAHARRLAADGAQVVLTDLNVDLGQQVTDSIKGEAVFVRHDVSDPASWVEVVQFAQETFGIPNVLVNNAGYAGKPLKAAELTQEDYLRTIAIDQHGVYYGMQAVIPGMLEIGGGSIVNISSTAGFRHQAGTPNSAYTTAKFAVRGIPRRSQLNMAPTTSESTPCTPVAL